MSRPALVVGSAVVGLAIAVVGASVAVLMGRWSDGQDASRRQPAGWRLTWSDDFDGPEGDPPSADRWMAEIGGEGWGNEERQYYTDSTDNAALDGAGNLVITAREDTAGLSCWYGDCGYTSARLITREKFAQAYGRFEARIKLPRGQGIWPAFWMLGDDITSVGWPASGEIDIMEFLGHDETTIHGALHAPGFDPSWEYTAEHSFADDFHTYAIDWTPERVRFYVDGHRYGTATKAEAGGSWAFDHPFFLLLNIAVGGRWPGNPDATTEFPQRMSVDYVRVYAAES